LLVIMSLVVYLFSLYNSPSEVTAELDNLTPNPSFENGGTQPEGWQGGGSGAEYSWADNTAHTGSRSVCIGNVDANKSGGWETISWIPVQEGFFSGR